MLTGDTRRVAAAVAQELGVDEFYADLLPQDKVRLVEHLAQQDATAMIGDGVNDAPALAVSHLGVAMGAIGSDVALETADVVLMRDDLMRLPYLVDLSRRARRIVWQNIGFSLAVIVVLILSVFAITLPLPLGVVGHEGSTLLVVMNGLRLLRAK
jgi:Cd2+/Zn2+-exporting ATPase